MNKLSLVLSFVLLSISSITTAQTAKEIAYLVYNKKSPLNGESDMTMTLINKKGHERVRVLHQYFIDLESVEKQLMFFTPLLGLIITPVYNILHDKQRSHLWIRSLTFHPSQERPTCMCPARRHRCFSDPRFTRKFESGRITHRRRSRWVCLSRRGTGIQPR